MVINGQTKEDTQQGFEMAVYGTHVTALTFEMLFFDAYTSFVNKKKR